ncbi:TIR domain-containing protein [Mucilaginibacter ginsenosidivorax]|uniref:TIR domain-containing protein n=1 Tax=Mucilaginibacter ginsenosidivorax TaxID=862126 RepID=A0A5B8W0I5_9SPHI|nr:TIR domain-containing protein [Mucilaginibacter ginsenosidivorax]QEC77470.1 TIR domain-containing protein [Mucilaginibacter ginsenosidivorax]
MNKTRNIFISHHGKDDRHVQGLKDRLTDQGYTIRNSSVDSTKHTDVRPSDKQIARTLKDGISWAGTFICLIGRETHSRPWVDYEIKQAYLQGKTIVGIYLHGCKDDVNLPESFKRYGGAVLGWNSIDKVCDAIDGKPIPVENPDSKPRPPVNTVIRVKCNKKR